MLGCAVAAFAGLLGTASPAGAVLTEVKGLEYGVMPVSASTTPSFGPMSYGGGPVVHKNATYALYWDPEGGYTGEWQSITSEFLKNVAIDSGHLDNVEDVASQYTDTNGRAAYDSTFRGAFTDVDPYPITGNCEEGSICLTDKQIRDELTAYIKANKLPTGLNPVTGATPIYFVFTPLGVTVCLDGAGEKGHCSGETEAGQLCSYHSYIPADTETGLETILYATQPWTAGNYGTRGVPHVSGGECQDASGVLQEPNQIGLGLNGEYNAGLADVIVDEMADDQMAILTDPTLTGWHDSTSKGKIGNEIADKCRSDFLGGLLTEPPSPTINLKTEAGTAFNQTINGDNYYVNDVFDQAAVYNPYPGVRCINHVNLDPSFTAQSSVTPLDQVTFSASESDVDLGIENYRWSFGDNTSSEVNCDMHNPTQGFLPRECESLSGTGNPNPVASVVHSYQYGGLYEVKLTITDDGGNTASVTKQVKVEGPPAPAPEPEPTPAPTPTPSPNTTPGVAGVSGSTGSATPPGQTLVSPPTITPPPVLSASVASKSLKKALSGGLAVRYTADEQVAGSIQILLEGTVARRLGVKGATATGLPSGTPRSIVVGSAVLVTTKAGQGTIRIKFSGRTAARLKRTHKLKLMLRLFARNASRQSPQTTTLLSTVILNP